MILLIQLRNGLRVSESVRAFKEFLKTKKFELQTKLSKKKREELRLVIIPREVLDRINECVDLVEISDKKLVDRVKSYCRYKYKFNTHSLRYAFITYLLRHGVNPSLIAKITKHSRLDFILQYTQEREAEKILRMIE